MKNTTTITKNKPKTKTSRPNKPRKPKTFYVIEFDELEGGSLGVAGIYHKLKDAKIDQAHMREHTIIQEYVVYKEPIWRTKKKAEIAMLQEKITKVQALVNERIKNKWYENFIHFDKKDLRRWNKEIEALQQELNVSAD